MWVWFLTNSKSLITNPIGVLGLNLALREISFLFPGRSYISARNELHIPNQHLKNEVIPSQTSYLLQFLKFIEILWMLKFF